MNNSYNFTGFTSLGMPFKLYFGASNIDDEEVVFVCLALAITFLVAVFSLLLPKGVCSSVSYQAQRDCIL